LLGKCEVPAQRCSIRGFHQGDLARVCEIESKAFPYPYPCHIFIVYHHLFPDLFLVVECDGDVVGYSLGIIEGSTRGHLVSIAVDEKFRRRGLGEALIKEFENRLKTRGASEVVLEVSVNNTAAMSLYKKLGYRIISVLRGYYPNGEDAYLMLKELL